MHLKSKTFLNAWTKFVSSLPRLVLADVGPGALLAEKFVILCHWSLKVSAWTKFVSSLPRLVLADVGPASAPSSAAVYSDGDPLFWP
ncbi:hypothetical protein RRG08_039219 [Elysia crispata]|uniref:Uncharacterized protein n=1 Tax=Elysia crispata TaxID=231223 RepID=A0AAE1ATD2_9GAST|nr:hypothetical protein RRG08_039219 [Elysia crispata]